MVLGNGWLLPDQDHSLPQDITHTEQLKQLVDNDVVSIYLHPSLRHFVKYPIEERFSENQRVRQELKKLDRYTTSEIDISLHQSFEEFEDLECPECSTFDEGLILVSAKIADVNAIVCTRDSKAILNEIIKLNQKYFLDFQIKLFDVEEFIRYIFQDAPIQG